MTVASIHSTATGDSLVRPLMISATPAGFPSPAEDHIDRDLDLNEHLIRRPAATFFVRVSGRSMVGVGINDGCVVTRTAEAKVRGIAMGEVWYLARPELKAGRCGQL